MKPIVYACIGLMTLGCQARPQAGMSAAKISVVAKPKAGVAEGFVHVPVYDAAPRPPVAGGQFEHVDYSKLSDIIVWLQPAVAGASVAPASLALDVDPAKPSQTVQAASVGQKIVFHNRSSSPVSLYSVSDGNDFELAPIAPGASGEYTVRAEGLIELLANPAKPPIAQIYAAPSRWVARTRSGHSITFNDVPPGKYEAIAWHPRLPGSSGALNLTAGHVARATVTIGVNSLPTDQ